MKTSTFATLGQSYLPTQPCSSLKRYEDIRGNDERQSHRVVRVAMFQLFQPLKLRKFHTISQPISWRFRSSVSKLESWQFFFLGSASEQPNQAANKPLERWEKFVGPTKIIHPTISSLPSHTFCDLLEHRGSWDAGPLHFGRRGRCTAVRWDDGWLTRVSSEFATVAAGKVARTAGAHRIPEPFVAFFGQGSGISRKKLLDIQIINLFLKLQ